MKPGNNLRGAIDHGMFLRLGFALILIVVVTGLIKAYALKTKAPQTTPRLAYKFITSQGLGNFPKQFKPDPEKSMSKDGWGHPFYLDTERRLILSAGKDELFQTHDDLYFSFHSRKCTKIMKEWMLESLTLGSYQFEKLPKGFTYSFSDYALKGKGVKCLLPDLSGPDRRSKSLDDLFSSVKPLFEGEPPPWRLKKTEQ